jgi:hypothetical protein
MARQVARHTHRVLVNGIVRVPLTAEINTGAVWEEGRELVNAVARLYDTNNLLHFKLILIEI